MNSEDPTANAGHYVVVVLIEQPFREGDAEILTSLHEGLDSPVTYHVLLPREEAPAVLESTLGSLNAGDLMGMPPVTYTPEELEEFRKQATEECADELSDTVASIKAAGRNAVGHMVVSDPVDTLVSVVGKTSANEVVILTRPHVVAEFFHVDWTSKARKRLGVPILHLLEHENFDEQAGQGEGITGV
ncbi:MAG TPA: hypothetical protein PKL71_04265 [Marmoricola sp.]|nr:hypothetical protein [Marmoricola sp.]